MKLKCLKTRGVGELLHARSLTPPGMLVDRGKISITTFMPVKLMPSQRCFKSLPKIRDKRIPCIMINFSMLPDQP